MKIENYRREFDELRDHPALFDPLDFRLRKEALNFIEIITKFRPRDQLGLIALQAQAQALGEELSAFNATLAGDFWALWQNEKPSPQEFRTWLEPYTVYAQGRWGQPHYGYESLDFLLDEILLPQPQPLASRPPEHGMVRYEATPASVILELTERISLTSGDVFYDFGAGMGKVTALVHLLTGGHCVGVEYQPDFCTYAEAQAQGLGVDGVKYLNADVRDVDYADGSVFFFLILLGGSSSTPCSKNCMERRESAKSASARMAAVPNL